MGTTGLSPPRTFLKAFTESIFLCSSGILFQSRTAEGFPSLFPRITSELRLFCRVSDHSGCFAIDLDFFNILFFSRWIQLSQTTSPYS